MAKRKLTQRERARRAKLVEQKTMAKRAAFVQVATETWDVPVLDIPNPVLRRSSPVSGLTKSQRTAVFFSDQARERRIHQQRIGAVLTAREVARRPTPGVRDAIPTAVRREVLFRDRHQCRYCRSKRGPFHMDHVIPWSKGGPSTTGNLVIACMDCNLKKGAQIWVPLPLDTPGDAVARTAVAS